MGDRGDSGTSISADSPSDETLNRGPLALLLRQQYEFTFGINIVQFSLFQFSIFYRIPPTRMYPSVSTVMGMGQGDGYQGAS